MAPPRPPRAAVRAAVRACLADLEPGERVIVALSGGADSLALTAASVAVGAELGLLCEAVVIDHRLQPGSGEIAARAAEQALVIGCVAVRVIAVDVARGLGSGGVEAAARAARYAALDEAAGATAGVPAAAILLGHTRADQAETVLLGLARGSGTRSLAGMAPLSGVYRRPLLDLPRDVVVAAALAAAAEDPRLEPWSDPHNVDTGFARVRVRHEVLPVLEAALGPGIVEALARTATLAREDADALDAWAERVWGQVVDRADGSDPAAGPGEAHQCGIEMLQEGQQPSGLIRLAPPSPATLPIAALSAAGEPLPPAIVNRVVRRLLIEAGCPTGSLTAGHIRAVAGLLGPGASARAEVALPGGLRARREAGALVVRV
jgi:tRNA(Ile)-lysidine synthase